MQLLIVVSQSIFYISLILVAIVFFFIGAWFYRLILWYPKGGTKVTGNKAIIGKTGQIVSNNGYVCVVRVDGQNWNAKNSGKEGLEVGDRVVVKQVNGLSLAVEKVKDGN